MSESSVCGDEEEENEARYKFACIKVSRELADECLTEIR